MRDRTTWLLVLTALGVFFAADDQTSVVAILPDMVSDVGLPQDEFYRAAWIVNGYILGYVVAMPLMGRVADTYGHSRVFAAALLLFCAASAWVALAQGLTMVSIARGVQAIGGGGVVPVSMAIVTANASPSRRILGLGAIAAASEAGGLLGPLWGGGIAELLGWRGVFWINLPLCLPVAFAVLCIGRHQTVLSGRNLDLPGAALIGGSLVCLTVALTDDPIAQRATAVTLSLFAGAAVLFGAFLLRETRAASPLIDLSFFRIPRLGAAFLANGLTGGTLIVAMVAVPLFTNVDARPITTGAEAREALIRQVASPVRWEATIQAMAAAGVDRFVEVGPGKVLSGLVRKIVKGASVHPIGTPEDVERFFSETAVV